MGNRIITISREYGSAGLEIAMAVAEKLGLPLYNRKILEKIAQESGYTLDFINEISEFAGSGNKFLDMLSRYDFRGNSVQDNIFEIQTKVIEDLAAEGPCVIVGRCADYILRDNHDLLKVFLFADFDKRLERLVNVYGPKYGEPVDNPQKRIRDRDARRKAYYYAHTDMEWGNAHNYDISLNSGVLGPEKCVEIITDLY